MSGGWPISPEQCNGQSVGNSTATSKVTPLTITTTLVQTKNAYTQLIASTVGDAQWMDITYSQLGTNFPINTTCYSDIAIGAGGSEVIIINNLTMGGGTNASCGSKWTFPVNIPNGSRVAARFAYSTSTTTTTNIAPAMGIQLFDGGMTAGEGFAGVDAVGQTNGVGTQLLTTTTANKKGAYTQLTAAAARDYAGFVINGDTAAGNQFYLIDVAVGAGGVEQNILSNYQFGNGFTGQSPQSQTIMMPVPSGTRISARAQCATASGFINCTFYGIYA